ALRMARGPGKGLLSVLSLTLLGGIFYLALNKPWW
ncbi:TPA: regulator SirB, partial [Pseudomonas aeruginosa]|nr:regulator SirB [Pseudomonas aeruginosa]